MHSQSPSAPCTLHHHLLERRPWIARHAPAADSLRTDSLTIDVPRSMRLPPLSELVLYSGVPLQGATCFRPMPSWGFARLCAAGHGTRFSFLAGHARHRLFRTCPCCALGIAARLHGVYLRVSRSDSGVAWLCLGLPTPTHLCPLRVGSCVRHLITRTAWYCALCGSS